MIININYYRNLALRLAIAFCYFYCNAEKHILSWMLHCGRKIIFTQYAAPRGLLVVVEVIKINEGLKSTLFNKRTPARAHLTGIFL